MEAGNPGIIFTIVSFIVGFSALVFIHEWGHYSVARLFKVRIEEFSIGFGKELYGWTSRRTGVRWKLSALPLGGYVKFYGDASAASNPDASVSELSEEEQKDCLHHKPLWQRALVVAAGPLINLIVPVFIFAAFAYVNGSVHYDPVISRIEAGSAAEKAGFQIGDRITKIDSRTVNRFADLASYVRLRPETEMVFEVERADGSLETITAMSGVTYMVDRYDRKHALGRMGVASTEGRRVDHSLFSAMGEGTYKTVDTIKSMMTGLQQIILGLRSIKEMNGPVGIAAFTGEAASYGLANYIHFLAFISISLGIMNLLPIPVLDGGHLVLYALEAIRGKPVDEKTLGMIMQTAVALIIMLAVFVTFNDFIMLAS